MKRTLSVFSVMIVIIILMNGVTGCMDENEYQQFLEDMGQVIDQNSEASIANAKTYLEQKYGISFDALKIGNRLGRDTTDLFMVPESKTEPVFKAVVNNETLECSDDFVRRSVGAQVSKAFCAALSQDDLETACCVIFLSEGDDSDETDYNLSVEEYIEKYQVQGLMLYLIVKSDKDQLNASQIQKTCDDFSQNYHVTVALNAYYLSDNYRECKKELITAPDVTSTWFNNYHPTDELVYSASYDAE